MGAAVFGIFAMVFSALSIRHVSYALLALICMFALEQWGAIYLAFVASNGSLVNIAVLLLVAMAWFRLPPGSTFEFVQYPTRTLLIFFLGYAFASTLWSPVDANATSRFLNEIHYLVAAVFLAPLLIRSSADFTRVLDAVTLFGGALVILFAFTADFEGRSLQVDYDLDETLGLPLALGDFGGFVMIITFLRLRAKLLPALWGLVVIGSALLLITKTGSRGQFFFAIATVLISFPLRWKNFSINRVMALLLVALLAVGALFIVVNTENTLSGRLTVGSEDADSLGTGVRVEMAIFILEAWVDKPSALMFGLGGSASWSDSMLSGYSHVVPVEIIVELGLFGFVLFCLAMFTLFLRAFTGTAKKNLSDKAVLDFAALAGCWVFAVLLSCKQGTVLYSSDLFMYSVLAEKCLRIGAPALAKRSQKRRVSNHKSHGSFLQ